jgi:hypothetical protein
MLETMVDYQRIRMKKKAQNLSQQRGIYMLIIGDNEQRCVVTVGDDNRGERVLPILLAVETHKQRLLPANSRWLLPEKLI